MANTLIGFYDSTPQIELQASPGTTIQIAPGIRLDFLNTQGRTEFVGALAAATGSDTGHDHLSLLGSLLTSAHLVPLVLAPDVTIYSHPGQRHVEWLIQLNTGDMDPQVEAEAVRDLVEELGAPEVMRTPDGRHSTLRWKIGTDVVIAAPGANAYHVDGRFRLPMIEEVEV